MRDVVPSCEKLDSLHKVSERICVRIVSSNCKRERLISSSGVPQVGRFALGTMR